MTNKKKPHPRADGRGKAGDTDYVVGSGNVFEDLGLANPGERLAKARLAAQINTLIAEHGWTQQEAARQLDVHQPTISLLRNGHLKSITYDRLIGWLIALDYTVEIRVKPAKRAEPHVEVAIAAG